MRESPDRGWETKVVDDGSRVYGVGMSTSGGGEGRVEEEGERGGKKEEGADREVASARGGVRPGPQGAKVGRGCGDVDTKVRRLCVREFPRGVEDEGAGFPARGVADGRPEMAVAGIELEGGLAMVETARRTRLALGF